MALKTDYKADVFEGNRKYEITTDGEGKSEIVEVTEFTQEGDPFGANDINEVNGAVNHLTDVEVPALKKSVSDGKALVAAAITAKRVVTAATATFAELAANIARIVLGSGNAGKADVLEGKTFTNDDGVEYAGTMPDRQGKHGSPGINSSFPHIPVHPMTSTQKSTATNGVLYYSGVPPVGYYSGPGSNNCYAGIAEAQIANMAGVAGNANKMLPSLTVAGVRGTIPDHTGKPTECTNARVNNNRLEVAVPSGYYSCSWDAGSYEYLTFARVASALGVSGNAGKMLNTLTIAGVRGTIANRNSAFHGLDCGVNNYGLFYHVLPGYYQEGANNPWVYRTLPEVAAALGITANKIKKGEVVCGMTGTWEGYVPTATDLYNNGHNVAGLRNATFFGYNKVKFETGMIVFDDAEPESEVPFPECLITTDKKYNLAGFNYLKIELVIPRIFASPSRAALRVYGGDVPINSLDDGERLAGMTDLPTGTRTTISFNLSGNSTTKYLGIYSDRVHFNIYRIWLS